MIFSNYHTESETGHRQVYKPLKQLFIILVGGFNPSEKYESKWESSPNRSENKKCLIPPASIPFPPWKILSCHVPEFCTAAQPNIVQQTSGATKSFTTWSSGNFRDLILTRWPCKLEKMIILRDVGHVIFSQTSRSISISYSCCQLNCNFFAPDSFTLTSHCCRWLFHKLVFGWKANKPWWVFTIHNPLFPPSFPILSMHSAHSYLGFLQIGTISSWIRFSYEFFWFRKNLSTEKKYIWQKANYCKKHHRPDRKIAFSKAFIERILKVESNWATRYLTGASKHHNKRLIYSVCK